MPHRMCLAMQTGSFEILGGTVRANATKNATICTDAHRSYTGLRSAHKHDVVDHSLGQYVVNAARTNGIENFCMLLERLHQVHLGLGCCGSSVG